MQVFKKLNRNKLINKLHIPIVIVFSYSLFFLLLMMVNPTNIYANGTNYLGLSAVSFFVGNWTNFLILATPLISIDLFLFLLDRRRTETIFSKESGNIFLTFIMVITLLFTLIAPTEFNLADQPIIYFSLVYLLVTSVICFLSNNKTIRAIFGVSSIILVITILFELMKLRYGIVMGNELMTLVFCKTGVIECKWFYLKRIFFLILLGFGLALLPLTRKKL